MAIHEVINSEYSYNSSQQDVENYCFKKMELFYFSSSSSDAQAVDRCHGLFEIKNWLLDDEDLVEMVDSVAAIGKRKSVLSLIFIDYTERQPQTLRNLSFFICM